MSFAQNRGREQWSVALQSNDRLKFALLGAGVIFASLGLGEAVYRFLFLDFDGATDRLPIEMLFGLGVRLDDYNSSEKVLSAAQGDFGENQVYSGSKL